MRISTQSFYLLLACYTLSTVARAQVDLPSDQGEEEYVPPSAQSAQATKKSDKKTEGDQQSAEKDSHAAPTANVHKEEKEKGEEHAASTEHKPTSEEKDPSGAHSASGAEQKTDEHKSTEHKKDEHSSAATKGGAHAEGGEHGDEAPANGDEATHGESDKQGGNGLVWFGVVFIVLLVLVFALT